MRANRKINPILVTLVKEIGNSFSSKSIPKKLFNGGIEMINKELQKKELHLNLIQLGRESDSSIHFLNAISFDCFSARAELALLCFNMNLPRDECKKAFDLVKDGSSLECPDCQGMLAHFYLTGYRGIVTPCYDSAYVLACKSANSGSWFGKMALAHFLAFYPSYHDEYNDKFDVCWDDPFICNFASQMQQLPDDYDDGNTVFSCNQLLIARHLVTEIQEMHSRKSDMPKVWLNLPEFQSAIVLDE
jgi:hypothetical protein